MKWLALCASLVLAQESQDVPSADVLKPGLVGHYWNVGKEMKSFPADLEIESASARRIDGMIDFDLKDGRGFKNIPWKEHVAVIWKGVLRCPTDADYVFTLDSSDGSKLYLDGKLVLDHDGTHPPREVGVKTVTLISGDHEMRLEYYHNAEAAHLSLSWNYADMEKHVIPSTAFWHRSEKGLVLEAK